MAKKNKKKKSKQKSKRVTAKERQSVSFNSIRQFAGACGVSHTTMREHLDRPDWPIKKNAPWTQADVDIYVQWRQMTMRPDPKAKAGSTTTDPMALSLMGRAQLAFLIEKTRTVKFDREVSEGKFIDRAEVETGRVQRVTAIKNLMLRLPRDLVSIIDYLPTAKRRKVEKDLTAIVKSKLRKMGGLDK